MRLRKFRVQGFRCIHDSGLVPVGDLAALIGKNESGKTALLQALLHLNRDKAINELDRCDEMWQVFEANPNLRVVEGTFELSSEETKAIREQVIDAPEIETVHMFRCLQGQVQYEFPGLQFGEREELDPTANKTFQVALQEFRTHAELLLVTGESGPGPLEPHAEEIASAASALAAPDKLTSNEATKLLESLKLISEGQNLLVEPLKKLRSAFTKLYRRVSIQSEVEKFIRDKLHPRFVYFSDYKEIHGAIKIPDYMSSAAQPSQPQRLDTGEPLDRRETIDNLFYLAGLEPRKLEEIKNSPARKDQYLRECGDRLTKALRPTWLLQPIQVEFIYDTGDVLWVRISDVHPDGSRTNQGMLSRRAAGFTWHFAFFVNFTAETRKDDLKDAVLLLDEPGLHLHPAQQAGTLGVLKGLANKNQIVYTTHSPFMIFDYTVGHLLTVELERDTHLSTIRPTYWDSDPETLIPILHALGAPEAFASASRAASKRPLVVLEGITDYQYVTTVLDLLATKNPVVAQQFANVEFVPTSGSGAIGPLTMYHKRRRREVVAFYDNEPDARQHAQRLMGFDFPEAKICYCRVDQKQESDIEDLFTEKEYLEAVNRLYKVVLKDSQYEPLSHENIEARKKQDPSLIRIVQVLSAIWRDNPQWGNFDKKKVCDQLCELVYEDNRFLGQKTLTRFENQLKEILTALRPAPQEQPPPAAAPAEKAD